MMGPDLTPTRRWMVMLLVVGLVALSAPPSFGGSGTQSDPWVAHAVTWQRPSVYAIAVGHDQEIRPTVGALGTNFWASQPVFTTADAGVYYYGIQQGGILQGSQPGPEPTKTANFSVFARLGGDYAAFGVRNLDSYRCSNGADGGPGVSCSVPYNWTMGTSYHLHTYITHPTNASSQCPVNASDCLIFTGWIAPTGGGPTPTYIGQWSLITDYSDLGPTVHFLENAGDPTCSHKPAGRYKYPGYNYPGLSYSPGVSGGDSGLTPECGRTYLDSFSVEVIYIP